MQGAIQLYEKSLVHHSPGHPDCAISLANFALSLWNTTTVSSTQTLSRIFDLLREGAEDHAAPPAIYLRCARRWVLYAQKVQDDTQLTTAYTNIINFLRRYLTIGPTVKLQYASLFAADLRPLPVDAACHAIQTNNIEQAVEWLDSSRSLLWSEMRRFREELLQSEALGADLVNQFVSLCADLQRLATAEVQYAPSVSAEKVISSQFQHSLSVPHYDIYPQKRKLLAEYDRLLAVIRTKPGLENFLGNLSFETLKTAAKEGPVIIINCSEHGSHVIIVFAEGPPTLIHLDKTFREDAYAVRTMYLDALWDARGFRSSPGSFGKTLETVASELWDLIVARVVEALAAAKVAKGSRIWWCPTSFLSILPFHAAGRGRKFLVDFYISSYTPTLKALIDARRPSPPSAPKAQKRYPHTFVVAQTQEASGLPSAAEEKIEICKLGPFVECIDEEQATREAVLRRLPSCTWVHFICHGTVSQESPFDSSLPLADAPISLNDIMKAHLPYAKFAFLAACHTAEQSAEALHDETLHLAAAMQSSGFRSVVGTMWEMEDKDGRRGFTRSCSKETVWQRRGIRGLRMLCVRSQRS
ncbi:hypothetical protein HGRIS_011085 [Hohenbuehelia grisea]|uniref:CHAT domain-containing protein n=1 Tax=Hohenbuehelia grisea TaxID=104357 RepID=A0ABR3IZA0_9AGAR